MIVNVVFASMTAKSLIELIPLSLFEEIGVETNVDNQVKKLNGDIVFKLILFSMLDTDKLSLRVMETFYHLKIHFSVKGGRQCI
jgi:hypothetical protein